MDIQQRAGKREWIGLAVLILPTLLLSIDVTVLHLAVPALSEDLRPTGAQLLWINDIYGFLIAGFLIPMGTLGDRIGRRRLLLIGAAAFALASAAAAYAPSAEVLIAARAALGVAGATLMPSTLSLIRTMFHDPAQRTTAISLWMVGFTGGMVIGPLLGGSLLETFWWGAAFLLGVPVMAVLLVAGPLLLPEYRSPAVGRIDAPSVVLSVAAALAVTYGVKELAAGGAGAVAPLSLVAGTALAVVFVRRQRGLAEPLLDLRLFAERRFSGALGTLMLVILVGPGIGLLTAQYLQLVLGLSPLEAGLWTLPNAVAIIFGFVATPALARRVRPAVLAAGGLVLGAAGVLLLTMAGTSGLAALVTGQTLFFLGGSPLLVLGIDIVVGAAPPERSGSAAALSETAQEFGGAAGLAVFGSIAAAVYQARLRVPEEVPAEAAAAARDTLGGAMAVASGQPASVAATLAEAARAAFTTSLTVTAAAASVVLLAAAILAATALRHVPRLGSSPDGS
ncbi:MULTISPECIES: MFS transporter [Nonomuraea]|uniref:MFS transporter n=1 Tax=Nonomuraea harbinensis TaxID=1286938 RepID=A0ABW1CAB4_9ACTN|nr:MULTISPECIES: MFS transporter [Nonomuraea]TXK38606.1 MFS transporter [Nonomuraea sp. C10]